MHLDLLKFVTVHMLQIFMVGRLQLHNRSGILRRVLSTVYDHISAPGV